MHWHLGPLFYSCQVLMVELFLFVFWLLVKCVYLCKLAVCASDWGALAIIYKTHT